MLIADYFERRGIRDKVKPPCHFWRMNAESCASALSLIMPVILLVAAHLNVHSPSTKAGNN